MKKAVTVLGIDPGFDRLGVAIIEKGLSEKLIYSNCLISDRKDEYFNRVKFIGDELEKIFKKFNPDVVVIEKIFFTNNQKTAVGVAEIRGVCIYLAKKYGCEIFEYSPPQIKLAVTGNGRASKGDISRMVSILLKQKFDENKIDDEIDAIAIALSHTGKIKWSKMN